MDSGRSAIRYLKSEDIENQLWGWSKFAAMADEVLPTDLDWENLLNALSGHVDESKWAFLYLHARWRADNRRQSSQVIMGMLVSVSMKLFDPQLDFVTFPSVGRRRLSDEQLSQMVRLMFCVFLGAGAEVWVANLIGSWARFGREKLSQRLGTIVRDAICFAVNASVQVNDDFRLVRDSGEGPEELVALFRAVKMINDPVESLTMPNYLNEYIFSRKPKTVHLEDNEISKSCLEDLKLSKDPRELQIRIATAISNQSTSQLTTHGDRWDLLIQFCFDQLIGEVLISKSPFFVRQFTRLLRCRGRVTGTEDGFDLEALSTKLQIKNCQAVKLEPWFSGHAWIEPVANHLIRHLTIFEVRVFDDECQFLKQIWLESVNNGDHDMAGESLATLERITGEGDICYRANRLIYSVLGSGAAVNSWNSRHRVQILSQHFKAFKNLVENCSRCVESPNTPIAAQEAAAGILWLWERLVGSPFRPVLVRPAGETRGDPPTATDGHWIYISSCFIRLLDQSLDRLTFAEHLDRIRSQVGTCSNIRSQRLGRYCLSLSKIAKDAK